MRIDNAQNGLSIADAARQLGVHYQTVRSWIGSGRLPVTRFGPSGGIVRIDPDDLARMGGPSNRQVVVTGRWEVPAVFAEDVRDLLDWLQTARQAQEKNSPEAVAVALVNAKQTAKSIAAATERHANNNNAREQS